MRVAVHFSLWALKQQQKNNKISVCIVTMCILYTCTQVHRNKNVYEQFGTPFNNWKCVCACVCVRLQIIVWLNERGSPNAPITFHSQKPISPLLLLWQHSPELRYDCWHLESFRWLVQICHHDSILPPNITQSLVPEPHQPAHTSTACLFTQYIFLFILAFSITRC